MVDIQDVKKAIRHFQCMRDEAIVVLDSCFGTHEGESDLLYRNRKKYAELAIKALEKQLKMEQYCIEHSCSDCPFFNRNEKRKKCMMDEFAMDIAR